MTEPICHRGLDKALEGWSRKAPASANNSPVLDALMDILDAKDRYTAAHCRRVRGLSQLVALKLDLEPPQVRTTLLAALYHDIGKLGIVNSVLNKPGRLDENDMRLMMTHPTVGRELVDNSLAVYRAALVIEQHHESWDGSGYPWGLSGTEILPEARVLKVCDVYDALITDRPYRKAFSHVEAVAIITAGMGTEFEMDAARALLEVTGQLLKAA